MSSGFELSLARLNESVSRRASNAVAVIDGGAPTPVIFDAAYSEAFGSIATSTPRAGLPAAAAPSVVQGSQLQIAGGATYAVSSVEPDGTGWLNLGLEKQ